jgi:hypothetical protein
LWPGDSHGGWDFCATGFNHFAWQCPTWFSRPDVPGSITLVRLDYPKGLFLVMWCGVMVYLTTLVGVENDVFLNGNMLIN